MWRSIHTLTWPITISDTRFEENSISSQYLTEKRDLEFVSEISVNCGYFSTFSLLRSTFIHSKMTSKQAVDINFCQNMYLVNTSIFMANQRLAGITVANYFETTIENCLFENCYNLPSVVLIAKTNNYLFLLLKRL